eukprot:93556_1
MSVPQKEISELELTVPKQKNVNDIWRELDAIFQLQIRHYVLSNDEDKFNAITQELGFNDIGREFLFDSIQTFTAECTSIPPITNKSSEKKSIYAIPTNKNEKICAKKRRRSDIIDNDSFSDYSDSDNERKTKKRKKIAIQNILESAITDKKKEELQQESIYIVDKIIGHREMGNHKYKYNVKWDGYNDTTWEPPENLMSNTIKKYWKSKGYKIDKYGIPCLIEKTVKKKDKKDKKDNNKIFKCEECDKIFKNGLALGGHKAQHSKKNKKEKYLKTDEQRISEKSNYYDLIGNEE